MISQIQPHFIYNTLGTIEQLCPEHPETASKLVHDFSLYLCGNFSQLDNAAPIGLSKELEHVRHYVEVPKLQDESKHIGIRNIRGRLEAMCNGTLTIDSVPGKGTTAFIKILKEEQE